jgi:hypothetical protein
MISTGQLNFNCAVISSLPRRGHRELNKLANLSLHNFHCVVCNSFHHHGLRKQVSYSSTSCIKSGNHQPLYTGITMAQSMCPACPKPLQHGLLETVTLTCLSTNNCHHLPRVSLSNNLPCVSLFPDMPGASLYITLTIGDNQSLTMFGASLSRHKHANSWLHKNNLSDCHTNSWLHMDTPLSNQHMVYQSAGTISNPLHMDNKLLNYNR